MDTQDLRRTQSSGGETHGVHVCSKCGWPFPNAHPSSRHRRAHKRVCGTIEGYRLAGSQEINTHLNDSDDGQSDEERKIPSPKLLQRSTNEKGRGLIGEGSVKSEDGVFSDAVAEFSDSGSGSGTRELLEDVRETATNVQTLPKNDLNAIPSGEIADNTAKQLGYAPEFEGLLSTSNTVMSSGSAVQDDKNGSEDDLHHLKYEMQTDASEDSKSTHDTDSVIESSLTSVSEEDKMKGNEACNLDRNLMYSVISPNKVVGEIADGASKLEGTIEMTSEPVGDIEVIPSEKERSHVDLNTPQIDLSPEVESVGHVDASVDTAERSSNFQVLSVPDEIQMLGTPEAMIEGFKHHKEEKLGQPTFLDSWEQFNDTENEVHPPVSNENLHLSSDLTVGTEASSATHDLEASHELDRGSSMAMVEEVPSGEEANVSEIEIKITGAQSSDETAAPTDVMPQLSKSSMVSSPEGQGLYDKNNESSQVNFSESDTSVLSESNSLIISRKNEKDKKCELSKDHSSKIPTEGNLVLNSVATDQFTRNPAVLDINPAANIPENGGAGDEGESRLEKCNIIGDAGNHETEKCKLTGDDNSKEATENLFAHKPVTSLESASSLFDLHVNPETSLYNDHNSGYNDDGEPEKSVSGNESRVDLSIVQDTQKSAVDSEIDCNDKIQLKVGVSPAAGSDHGSDVKSSQNSLEDCGMEELGLSSIGAESSILSSSTAGDNCPREFLGVSGLNSQSLQEESDKNFVTQQPSSPVLDIFDSNSQTDSVEGNWGSVSVLSIQSDAQAVLDAEAVPPTDSQASLKEKSDLQKSKAASDAQYQDKSDMFEAPSFMTLVEPGGLADQKATAAEIQREQNLEQPKPLQAGWFPSITQVVNESQGRKKNEEIISKVTNWSTGKLHTPLKNLLGEAYLENKAKSTTQKETAANVLQKDDKAVKNGGPVATTVNSILAPESPTGQAANKDNAKEWNSPARYPTEINSEKGKAKGRPYWAQFLCCSSVH